ncbi:MAG: cyclic nucleotide-binding domain-containing protein [Deltaproteobacteria bacterium]|nr:cyclic nucleotide-binding domain-containing protein [Deltaproteobacteria bacterium]
MNGLGNLTQRAEAAIAAGDARAALGLLQQLDAEGPQTPRVASLIAEQHKQLGDVSAYAEWMYRAGERLTRENKPLSAVAALKCAHIADPSHAATHALLSEILEKQKSPIPRRRSELVKLVPSSNDVTLFDLIRQSTPPPPQGLRTIDLGDDDSVAADVELMVSSIPNVPMFRRIDPKSFRLLVDRAHLVTLSTDEVVFEEGSPGDSLFVILEGGVDVLIGKRIVAHLGDGEFFGEVALFSNRPRGATVRATRATHLLELSRADAIELSSGEPELLASLLSAMKDRLASQLLSDHPLLVRLTVPERRRLIARFVLVDLAPGHELIREGHPSPGLFLVLEGRLAADQASGRRLGTLEPGDLCGEMSLVTGRPAVATVSALQASIGFMLPASDFQAAIDAHPELYRYASELTDRRLLAVSEGRVPIY